MDMIIKTAGIPRPGETVLGGSFSMAAGGKGANQAVAAARAGGKVVLIARVGEDYFGERAIKNFVADQIDVGFIVKDKETPSGVALIFVDDKGENSIAVAAGANARLSKADVELCRDIIAAAGILLMQLETPLETVEAAAEIASAGGVKVILNPAPARKLPIELLRHAAILTPNESEAEVLTGIHISDDASACKAADALQAKGVGTVIITLGSRGALLADGSVRQIVAGFPVHAVDTTGAGDVFNGALAVAISEGKALAQAVPFACAAAAISVTRLGAQPSIPHRKDIDAFIADRAVSAGP